MLMNINNSVMVIRMVRVSSWVRVNRLVIVMDGFMMDWLYLMRSIAFDIMRDCFMWHEDIISSGMMVMVVVVVSMVVLIRMIMSVLELYNTVLIIVVVGVMINFMICFMVNIFVTHIMVFRLTALNMRFNLVNRCLFKRPMV